MTEAEKRSKRACFTGHRPHKLNGMPEGKAKAMLNNEILKAYREGFRTFITGMAMGVDIWAGELVLELREKHDDVHLICAIPFRGFENRWSTEWQRRCHAVLSSADLVKAVSDRYSADAYQVRNEWMVDRSARVIAIYNGDKKSGTKNTIDYAEKNGIPIVSVQE